MEKKYLKLNDIDAYKIAFNLSNYVWDLIVKLDRFSKDTLGIQFVRSIDSISANIAEGLGRYSKKDKVKFFRIGFGSMYESLDWNEKALMRKLISKTDYDYIYSELQKLPKLIHQRIKFTNSKLSE
ncbi:MAG: four helix bundle protein [Ignavibacterium sp.]|jgi:four helix bundle protein|nr:four helix bundle protein [Ignavibacterium sp.]